MNRLKAQSGTALRAAVAVAVLAALAAATSCAGPAPQPEHVEIGATTFPASAPVYIAEEKGFFEDEGLAANVHTYDAGAIALADALAGTIDFATVAETPIARAALDNRSFKVIATVAEVDRANYIIAREDRGIARATDLVGKRLGYVPGTTGDFFQHIYLVASRIDPSGVIHVELTPDTLVHALVQGDVDAVSTWPPFTSELETLLGDNAVKLDEPGLYVMSWNVVVPGSREGGSPVVEKFIRALVAAHEYMDTHPEEAQQITSRRTGIDIATLQELWPNLTWMTGLDQTLLMTLEDEARWMISESGAAREVPDFLQFIDATALRQIRPWDVDIVEPLD